MKKITSVLISIIIICISVLSVNAEININSEIVLFSGNATAEFTDWSDWGTAVSLGRSDFNISDFSEPFYIEIEYESNKPPILVFLSWSGGKSWAEMIPTAVSNGCAYYSYDDIVENYGTDFDLLNSIRVKPYGESLTVTKITLIKGEKDFGIKLLGTAGEIAENINVGWNLGNALDCDGEWIGKYTDGNPSDYETAWHNPETTETMIKMVKNAGFNAIRLPVSWYDHMDTEYNIDTKWLNRVQEVVDYIINNDMYCIINVHHDTGKTGWLRASETSLEENKRKYYALWNQIANRFSEYGNHLLFESFNEILDDENNWGYPGKTATSIVNELNQLFVDTIRSTGGNNITRCLVVNTYAADADSSVLNDFVIPNDIVSNSIIVEVHCYQPWQYCSKIEENDYQQTDWTENDGKHKLEKIFYNLFYNYTSQGIPVIIGEFAAGNKDNTENRAEYAEFYINEAKKYGIKCFWWDNGGVTEADENFGYFTGYALLDRYNYKWIYPEIVEALTKINVENVGCMGDVNYDGEVNIVDVTEIQKYIAGYIEFENQTLKISDTDLSGIVDIKDATKIQKMIVGIN